MAGKTTITPEEGAELDRLYAQLGPAQARVMAALKTGGRPMEGAALQEWIDADAAEGALWRRIREIHGVAGEHWMAV